MGAAGDSRRDDDPRSRTWKLGRWMLSAMRLIRQIPQVKMSN